MTPPQARTAFPEIARELSEVGRDFYARGWAPGTSGNFSAVVTRDPFTLAVTASGVDKGCLEAASIILVDAEGNPVEGRGAPSAETLLHLAVARASGAGAILHTHSIWSTIVSEDFAGEGGPVIEGYELLKGLEGVRTHEHRERLPIIENSQDMTALAASAEKVLSSFPRSHGFLIRRHGLYTWGSDLREAKRHIEVLEFLLEVIGRTRSGHLAVKRR